MHHTLLIAHRTHRTWQELLKVSEPGSDGFSNAERAVEQLNLVCYGYCISHHEGRSAWPRIRFVFFGGFCVSFSLMVRCIGRHVTMLLTLLTYAHVSA